MNLRGLQLTPLVFLISTMVTESSEPQFPCLSSERADNELQDLYELCNSTVPWCLCMRLYLLSTDCVPRTRQEVGDTVANELNRLLP